jgi:hypothetical protein
MNNIVDYTYFKNRLQIANLQSTTDTDVRDALTSLITTCQYNFLNGILGPALYVQFKAWYEVVPLDPLSPFYNLLNGEVFEDENGYTHNWIGLQNEQKLSPLANFAYYTYQELNFTQTTSAGEVRSKADNSRNALPLQKMIEVWAEMVVWLCGYYEYMKKYFGITGTGDWAKYHCKFLEGDYAHKVNFIDA